jgi:hypothetical protein
MSIDTEFFGGQPPKWVSGTTYPLDFIARSPLSQHYYVRIIAGAGTTDPSGDGTNWARVGAGGRKSIQEGVINIPSSTATQTATVTAINMATRRLTLLGSYATATSSNAVEDVIAVLEMTNATTITARRIGAGAAINVRYQLEETW